ncbi:S8 family serine peptidase [Kitasatospora sp. NBC_00374]|uniref:S8 family serine peptidase n=1 Tax=Kitasatospora sp. NBC_00374 TaxID=2975964 RepID=UPI0030E461A8
MANGYEVPATERPVERTPRDERTGRFLVLLEQEEMAAGLRALEEGAGVAGVEHVTGGDAGDTGVLAHQGSLVFDDLGVAVITVDPEQQVALESTVASTSGLAIEPERAVYACTVTTDYLRGYRDGMAAGIGLTIDEEALTHESAAHVVQIQDGPASTWGVRAVLASEATQLGHGVGIAVLDTGVAANHADLSGRVRSTRSFVPGEEVEDGHGHGTHCCGTVCGGSAGANAYRYGVAPGVDLYAGKVLNNRGRGTDTEILFGIEWAMNEKDVRVISLSLTRAIPPGQGYSPHYERAAQRAMQKGTLIVAAAGNYSTRPGYTAPVSSPANCPTIVAVGAVDPYLGIADFSCGGQHPNGGEVSLVGPGVNVYSAWRDGGYKRLDGTSMATPHVAGVAALMWEQRPEATVAEIKSALRANARVLPLSSADAGAGLAQVPLG